LFFHQTLPLLSSMPSSNAQAAKDPAKKAFWAVKKSSFGFCYLTIAKDRLLNPIGKRQRQSNQAPELFSAKPALSVAVVKKKSRAQQGGAFLQGIRVGGLEVVGQADPLAGFPISGNAA
jgi:hypothetical protein